MDSSKPLHMGCWDRKESSPVDWGNPVLFHRGLWSIRDIRRHPDRLLRRFHKDYSDRKPRPVREASAAPHMAAARSPVVLESLVVLESQVALEFLVDQPCLALPSP